MKRLDILCPSQASTAICLSMDQASCSSSNTIQLGGKAIDRHNPIINDSRRTTSKIVTYNDHQKAKKESSSSKSITSKEENNKKKISKKGHEQKKKKSSEEKVTEHVTTTNNNYYSSKPIDSVMRKSWIKPNEDLATTPAGSTRCLLSESALLDGISDYDPVLALSTSIDNKRVQVVQQDEISTSSKPSSSNLPKSGSSDQQVVVLRVSLHCKGCEGKVRKHLSRMQGVSSFNIDFAAKKVTVVGDVTPLSVLASISKVKNAQFWSPSASAIGYGTIETMKNNVYN